jgi:hypothetical protein
VWCQIGVHQAERGQASRTGKLTEISKWGMREWYVLTYIFGAIFIAGQVYEYAQLVAENVTLSSDAYGSVFYMATGFHGCTSPAASSRSCSSSGAPSRPAATPTPRRWARSSPRTTGTSSMSCGSRCSP